MTPRRRSCTRSTERQRTKLVTAMAEVERLLIASTVEVRECSPRHRDAQFLLADLLLRAGRPLPRGLRPSGQPGCRRRNDAGPQGFCSSHRYTASPSAVGR